MKFTFTVTLAHNDMVDVVADLLESAAAQLRSESSFGDACADGFTTQNVKDEDGEWIDPYATYKLTNGLKS